MSKKYMKNNLVELRKKRGLTQAELAERAGTTEATISRLETGDRQLNSKWLERLGKALKVKPAQIVEGTPPLDSELEHVIALYDKLSDDQRRLWFRLGDTLVEQHNFPEVPGPGNTPKGRNKITR
jgi:transcriptional regulator with XRE-family HTH domain